MGKMTYDPAPIPNMTLLALPEVHAIPSIPPPPSTTSHLQVKLPNFIAHTLPQAKLHSSLTFAALVLLQRLKARLPTTRGS
jgi:hypothetical protein